jgi:hypothetical protein
MELLNFHRFSSVRVAANEVGLTRAASKLLSRGSAKGVVFVLDSERHVQASGWH